MSAYVKGVNCGVLEWVKRTTLRWFGHVERMESEELVKRVNESELKGTNRRGRPLGRWKDRMEEYLGEKGINGRGVLEQARRECWDKERWRFFYRDHPAPGGTFRKIARCQGYR